MPLILRFWVGPVWSGGQNGEDALLARCYQSVLTLAKKCFVRTIAFPSISTGAYHFPVERAAKIALSEIQRFLEDDVSLEEAQIVCFDETTRQAYQKAQDEIAGKG